MKLRPHAKTSFSLSLVASVLLLGGCQDTDASTSNSEPKAMAQPTSSEIPTREGIDVSHYQGGVDWAQVKAAGKVFAFAKATEGSADVDPNFDTNWSAMKAAGIVRGAYHFFQPDEDATAQAEHFIATVHLEAGDLPPVIDIEITDGKTTQEIDAAVRTWLEKVAAAYGVQPIVYSDLTFLEQHLASGFGDYPLWVADYSQDPPTPPGDWQSWTFWQYSESGTVVGISGDVDLDRFQGTDAEWQSLRVTSR